MPVDARREVSDKKRNRNNPEMSAPYKQPKMNKYYYVPVCDC